ncbi:hypothetical protein M9458_037277, partial [Cirrhinus mrigala]
VKEGQSLTVKQFQQLLGLMAAVSNVIPFGLLYMRPLQWWLKTKGFCPRGNPLRMIKVTRRKPWFLNQGPVLGAPCRRVTLATDASLTGWGVVMSGRPAQGLWHINCLEMLAVFRALKYFLPDPRDRHVVYYINHQRGLCSRPLYNLAHQILVWSQDKLLSLRAVHVPGHLNVGADVLSRQVPRPGEWMLHPKVVKQIWKVFGPAQVDLFATRENAQSPLGLDAMVQTWPRLRLYAFPPIALLPGVLERVRRDEVSLLLVAPYCLGRVWLSHSTLKVYVAAISAYHAPLGGLSVGKDPLVIRFLRGVLRLRPPVQPHVPTWDLAVVLKALCRPPFEPIEEILVRFLTIKTALLLALISLKRVGDLQALSVAPSHLEFAPGMTKAFLYPSAG